MKQQNGFVLVSVLVITTITTMLAIAQIKETRLQDRIGGNQQKEINARLAAEKGVLDLFEYIAKENEAGTSNTAILDQISQDSFSDGENYSFEQIALTGSSFAVVSKGSYSGADAYLKTSIQAIEESGSSVFNDAVAGCDGVYVGQGGGIVDSYDSRVADYDPNNANENGSVSTINSGADIEMSGSGSVYGDLVSNGDITTGTSSGSSVTGAMTAANNIQLKGVTSTANIHSGGDFHYQNLSATGESITVGGNISKDGGNGANTISSSVIYGGENTAGDFGTRSDNIVAPKIDFGVCDPLEVVDGIDDNGALKQGGISKVTDQVNGIGSDFTASSATTFDGVQAAGGATPIKLDVLGEEKAVYVFDEFSPDHKVTITGDITLLIKGDTTFKGLEFVLGNEESSLTILTTGKVNLDSRADLFPGATVNSQGEPPLTIYSSYEGESDSDFAVDVGSNGDMYARIYAPSGNINLGGGGDIMGAVRGKEVNVSSGTGIHYDEALSDIIDIKDEDSIPASYSSVHYYYPNS